MHRPRLLFFAAALAIAASACSERDPGGPADAAAPVGQAPAPPAPPSAPSPPVPPAPVSGPVYDEALVNFGGYRTASFNSDAAALRAAAEGILEGEPDPDNGPDGCYYLMPPTGSEGYEYAFMMVGGRFVRVDVDTTAIVAPGGLVVGMSTADVLAAFPATEQQPHHYTDGKYLVVAPADGGEGRLVFEVDAGGTIERWRIGLEPQVHYVEGCS
jgi:hypothetical protein